MPTGDSPTCTRCKRGNVQVIYQRDSRSQGGVMRRVGVACTACHTVRFDEKPRARLQKTP